MIHLISILFYLHLLALHCSIALMEMFSWTIFAGIVGHKIAKKSKFRFAVWPPLVALIVVTLISTYATYGLKPFWFQFGFMRWVLLLWAYVWAFEEIWSARFERILVRCWSSFLCIASAYAIFQCLTGKNPILPHVPLDPERGLFRATGFFSLTLTCAYVFGTSYFAILRPSFQLGKKWGYTVAILGGLGILSTLSRGAWLAALVAGFIYLAWTRRRWLPYFVGLAVIAILGFAHVNPNFNKLLHLHIDHSSGVRLHLWRAYFQMFLDHPFVGIGIFQGDKLLPEYYQRLGIVEPFVSHAHNVLLQWLAGTGIFGFAAYLWLSITLLVKSWRLRDVTVWGWSLFLSQVFCHIGGLTECNFIDAEVTHMLILVWALVLFFDQRSVQKRTLLH